MNTKSYNEFSKLSYDLTKSISKPDKKKYGIFFTPPKTIQRMLKRVESTNSTIQSILEPSCGSGEFMLQLLEKYPNASIHGIEKNERIFESIKNIPNCHILHCDFLQYQPDHKYDLIIGNPPFFVMKKTDIEQDYFNFFEGRPNIFILFIVRAMKCLSPNGILSFILPKNFLNCLYYDKLRKYISKHFTILHIESCEDNYIDTKQDTIIFMIQNKTDVNNNNAQFSLSLHTFTIFGESSAIEKLKSLYQHSTTLKRMGFSVHVGNVVWNQCKDILSDNPSHTLLVYSSDIKNNTLQPQTYANPEKKNYIQRKGNNEPVLLINRGYGVGTYHFTYCLLEGGFEYLIENHLICIQYTQPIKKNDLIDKYKFIIKSLRNEKTHEFIRLYFGNNAINTTELCNILPIYDI